MAVNQAVSFVDVRAAYKFSEIMVVTSPNVDFIPQFPYVEDEGIYIRADGSYGPQEFTHWPQLYTQDLCHHAAIPLPPKDPSDTSDPMYMYSMLFRIFTRADWIPLYPLPQLNDTNALVLEFSGGFLRKSLYIDLKKTFEYTVNICLKDHKNDKLGAYGLANALVSMGRGALKRLERQPDSASQVVFIVRDVQRAALELLGIHNWMTIFQYRGIMDAEFRGTVGRYVGSFSREAAVVQHLHDIGIPVWFIRRPGELRQDIEIPWVTSPKPFNPTVAIERWRCVNGTLLFSKAIKDGGLLRDSTGLFYDNGLHSRLQRTRAYSLTNLSEHLMALHSQDMVKYEGEDEYKTNINGKRKAPEANNSSGKSKKKKMSASKKGYDPASDSLLRSPAFTFISNICPDAPPLPPACKDAFKAVSPLPRPQKRALFFFPPPWMLYAPDGNVDRRNRLFHNYIRIRDFCLRRYHTEHIDDLAKGLEFWREAVKGNYKQMVTLPTGLDDAIAQLNKLLPPNPSEPASTNLKATAHNRKKYFSYASARAEFGCNGEMSPYDPSMIVPYDGRQIALEDLNDSCLRRKIQLELFEMSWRAELLALDYAVLKGDPRQTSPFSVEHYAGRRLLVVSIWSPSSYGSLLFPNTDDDIFGIWDEDSILNLDSEQQPVSRLLEVMSVWPDYPVRLKELVHSSSNYSVKYLNRHHLHTVLEQLFKFYTATFCRVFQRLPILPCLASSNHNGLKV